jgi:hypothetical protein
MNAHVGLTIESEQANFSALQDFYFFAAGALKIPGYEGNAPPAADWKAGS